MLSAIIASAMSDDPFVDENASRLSRIGWLLIGLAGLQAATGVIISPLIEKIEAKFNRKTRAHELDIHFRHPIVGDGIKWKDPKKKTLGYKVLNGTKTTQIRVEKRDGRGK